MGEGGKDGSWSLEEVMTVPYEIGEKRTGELLGSGGTTMEKLLKRFSSGSNEASALPKVAMVSSGMTAVELGESDLLKRLPLMIWLKVLREGSAWLVLRVTENNMTLTIPAKKNCKLEERLFITSFTNQKVKTRCR